MRIIQINTFPHKATGNIMMSIHNALLECGADSYVVWGRGRDACNDREISINDELGIAIHGVYSRVFDKTGFASWRATRKLVEIIDKIKPDIVHLHNLHGYYLNIKILFGYLSLHQEIKVVWTIHDCWPITGHCAYFTMVGCDRWKIGCKDCMQLSTYPVSKLLDNSTQNWFMKKSIFNSVKMSLVTPSHWLEDVLKQSFLKEHKVQTIYNGVDLEVFKPTGLKPVNGLKGRALLILLNFDAIYRTSIG